MVDFAKQLLTARRHLLWAQTTDLRITSLMWANRTSIGGRFRKGIAVVVVLAAVVGSAGGYFAFRENFHVVAPGVVYRSAQPSSAALRRFHEQYGILSVINLRGTWIGEPWFDQETATAAELGIEMRNVDMATHQLTPPGELRKLVQAFDECPRPLLIHCRHGADRTALALAVYKVLFENASLDEAMSTYQLRCGHTGLAYGRHLPHLFDDYRVWLAETGSIHSPSSFRQWIEQLRYVGPFAALTTVDPPRDARVTDHELRASIQVTNNSRAVWFMRNAEQSGNYLWIRVHDAKGNDLESLDVNAPKEVVAPGESFSLSVRLKPIDVEGRYFLRVELVDDHGFRFGRLGCGPWLEDFKVTP